MKRMSLPRRMLRGEKRPFFILDKFGPSRCEVSHRNLLVLRIKRTVSNIGEPHIGYAWWQMNSFQYLHLNFYKCINGCQNHFKPINYYKTSSMFCLIVCSFDLKLGFYELLEVDIKVVCLLL